MIDSRQPTLAELTAGLDKAQLTGNPDLRIPSIVYDSRHITEGSLFVALRGSYSDGHDFLRAALDGGAAAAVVEPDTAHEKWAGFASVARVPDTRAALAQIASQFYRHPGRDLTLIGVTGTDGKTTTTFFIERMLRTTGQPTGLIGTVGIRMTGAPDRSAARQSTPESLDTQRFLAEMRDAGISVAIVEATSHGLAMHRLDGCAFDIGVVTNVTHEHLDFHGTIENYRAAKGSLLGRVHEARSRGKLGVCVLNADDPGARGLAGYAGDCRIVWYSISEEVSGTEIGASRVALTPDGSSFDLKTPRGTAPVSLSIPGRWNVSNALAAAAVGHVLGLQPDRIAAGLGELGSVPGRMERIDLGQPFSILVDYAHTPEALRSVLVEARTMGTGRVLVLFGSAGERDIAKRGVQGSTAIQHADYAIFTSEDPRFEDPEKIIADIAAGATQAGGIQGVDFDCIEDRGLAIRRMIDRAGSGDIVVLAGKGHERSMIYGSESRPWDERSVALAVLRALGYGFGLREDATVDEMA